MRFSTEQEALIQQELRRILVHSCFQSSERCSKLLRYIVDVAVADQSEQLKERVIGNAVFGRPIAYETGSDPIVRNAALELRRRLAQYQNDQSADQPIVIHLRPGSYIPFIEFASRSVTNTPQLKEASLPEPNSQAPAIAQPESQSLRNSGRLWKFSTVAVVAFVGILAAFLYLRAPRGHDATAVDPFWQPLLSSTKEVLIAVSEEKSAAPPNHAPSAVPFVDAKAYANIVSALSRYGKSYQVMLADQITFRELRDRPVVVVGGFPNPWTLKLMANARYRVGRDDKTVWLEDSMNPSGPHPWEVDRTAHLQSQTTAYAVIGRFRDPTTGGIVVTVTGVGPLGTEAASDFLINPARLQGFPSGMANPNMNAQFVIKAPVVDGVTGVPAIEAIYSW